MLHYAKLCVNHLKTQSTTLLASHVNLLEQQSRNTFILKRRYPVPLYKKNQRPHKLTHKYFIYDLVENTVTKRPLNIDMILVENVKDIGRKGEKISVQSEKAYNNFLLPKLAVYATPENMEKYYIKPEDFNVDKDTQSSQFVNRTISVLSQIYVKIMISKDVPWTLEKWHVRVCFRRIGIIVPEDAITMPNKSISGPNLDLENKEFYVTLKINNHEEVKVRCRIYHWNNDISQETKYWGTPSVAIFPEDQEILDSLPKPYSNKSQKTDNAE
ncbi:PREDICTED: 39S ribosomal protein L9, mitochondrial [Dufourea novaeangliae]|nr:PREDICTED: 39S ribosomal protein L9, mitochondrial [Dufourea novaeangliae]